MQTILSLAWLFVLVCLGLFLLCSGFSAKSVVAAATALTPPLWAVVAVTVVAVVAAGGMYLYLRLRSRKKWYQFWK